MLSGDKPSRVDEACDELRHVLEKMELSSQLITSSSRGRCRYLYAVSEAFDHAWKFVRTPQPVSDVNTKRFPYELVQHHRNFFDSPVQDAGINTRMGSNFLLNFSDACVASAV